MNIFIFLYLFFYLLYIRNRELSGSVVECLTKDRRAAGSSLTGFTGLCPWARHIYPSLVLVQPRKTCPYMTENLLMERKDSNQTNKNKYIRNALTLTHISLLHHWTIYYTKKMYVIYHHGSNEELPHPPPLTRLKLLAPSYGTYNPFFTH